MIPELRKEIRSVMAANDNVMTTQALYQMKLLDSVMRESQRCNPATPVRLVREVLKTFKFSDGTEIPAGTTIGLPHLSTTDISNPTKRSTVIGLHRSPCLLQPLHPVSLVVLTGHPALIHILTSQNSSPTESQKITSHLIIPRTVI